MRSIIESGYRLARAAALWVALPFAALTVGLALLGYAVYFALVWVAADIIFEIETFKGKVFGEEADKS